jgi:hypothetical protein
MQNEFIILYRDHLTSSEKEGFRQYIQHFYAQQKAILEVFEQVVKCIDNKKERFPSTESSHKNILNAFSDLKRWLIEFLTIQQIKSKNTSFETKFYTLDVLQKRGLTELSAKKSEQLTQELQKHPSTNSNLGLSLMQLKIAHNNFFTTDIDKQQKEYKAEIQRLIDLLDNCYFGTKLKYSAELATRKYILQEAYNSRLLNELLVLIETDNSLDPIIKNFYLKVFNLTKYKSDATYTELKNILINDQVIDKKEKLAALVYLINYTAHCISQGQESYYTESFELAKLGINQSLFIADGFFPTLTFSNIINIGCHLQEYKWTKDFIKDWSGHLKQEDIDIVSNLALARVSFEEQLFDTAFDFLNKIIHHKNTLYSIQIRILMARTYYELKTDERSQNYHCRNLKTYIERTNGAKKNILNFLNILHFLINYKPEKQTLKKQEILRMLGNKLEPIAFREWLQQKFDALNP